MAYSYDVLDQLKKLNNNELDTKINPKYSFDIGSIIRFSIDNYKQILLLLLAFVIIYVVDHITYYNTLFYGLTSSVPGTAPSQQQIKPTTFKKKYKKNRK